MSARARFRLLAAAAAIAGALPAYGLFFSAIPECVVVPYFLASGAELYTDAPLPYTPLLLLLVAAAGKAFGFTALVLRGVMAAAMAASGALIAVGLGRRREAGLARVLGVALALALHALWTVHGDGPALWFDPFAAPFLLASALALESWERDGRDRGLVLAGLLLGTAILVKQTTLWVLLAALVWTAIASRRGGARPAVRLGLLSALPYAGFALSWAAGHQTVAHLRWNLLVPFTTGMPGQQTLPDAADVLENLPMFLAVPALALLRRLLPPANRLRSPAPWLAVAVLGMAFPRWGNLHLSGAVPLLALLAGRSVPLLLTALGRARRRSPTRANLVAGALGAGLLLCHLAVAFAGIGPTLLDRVGGLTRYLEDRDAVASAAIVARRVPPGGAVYLFNVPWDTVYVLTGTRTPDRHYFNATFWWFLRAEGLDLAAVRALRSHPETPILFREPGDPELTRGALYEYLSRETEVIEQVDRQTTWRRARRPAGSGPDRPGAPVR